MKNPFKTVALFAISLTMIYCSQDDTTTTPDTPENDNSLTTIESITLLTDNGNTRQWKIEQATLTNNTVANLDITSLLNVQDDVFTISDNGANEITLRHSQDRLVNGTATDVQSAKTDRYDLPKTVTLTTTDTENPTFTENQGAYTLSVSEESGSHTVSAVLTLEENATLQISLEPLTTPASVSLSNPTLTFSEPGTFFNSFLSYSYSADKLFFKQHFDHPTGQIRLNSLDPNGAQLTSIDVPSSVYSDHNFYFKDDKVVLQNELGIHTMALTLNSLETENSNPLPGYTDIRFTVLEERMVALSCDLFADENAKVFKSEPFSDYAELADLGAFRSQANSVYADGKLYVMGGVNGPFSSNPDYLSDLQIVDITTGTIESTIPFQPFKGVFATRKGNLIYVAGNRVSSVASTPNGNLTITENYAAVINMATGTIQEIDVTNILPAQNTSDIDFVTIVGLTADEDALYFGVQREGAAVPFAGIEIYKATIN